MAAFDTLVQLLLYVCFGAYLCIGIAFIALGGYYMNEVGEAADTALVLLMVGGCMLVVGGVAMFANFKQGVFGGTILFVVEIINMVLFLVLYIFIIAAIMMALGINDPVRKATEKAWPKQRPELEKQNYCQETGYFCNTFYLAQAETSYTSGCAMTPGELVAASTNCSLFHEYALDEQDPEIATIEWMATYGTCGDITGGCQSCDKECMEHAIKNVKDYMVPGAVAVLLLSFYSIAAVVINAWVLSAVSANIES